MNVALSDRIAAIRRRCRFSIAIPAKNEHSSIPSALAAFGRQAALDGTPLDPDIFEVLVLANDCTDGTAEAVRAFSAANPGLAVHVVSTELPPDAAHVGTARRTILDIACRRQERLSGEAGLIGSTDADSRVDRFWVAQTLAEMTSVDAVAGHVEIASVERDTMDEPMRALYERECYYRRLSGELEALYDPLPFDPPPRHTTFVATSFAVRTETYVRAGRLPVLRQLEDAAFARALRRIDARIRHSYDVRVETSARSLTRVVGGFGTYLAYLRDQSSLGQTHLVDNGKGAALRVRARGLLRSYWAEPTDIEDLEKIAELYRMKARDLFSLIDPLSPFGETLERIEATSIPFEALPEEPIEDAIAAIRDAISAATPSDGTRPSAASVAGR